MKKILTSFALVLAGSFAFGQYYYFEDSGNTPGGLNQDNAFPAGGGQPAGWTSILGPSVATPTWSAVQSLPFAFDFNGSPVTDFVASSTGVVTFTTAPGAAPAATPAALPSASIPDNSVCIWGMNAAGTNDNVSTKTFGTAPNRQHWVHYSSCTNGSIAWSYYSIVFEETSNKIYIVDQRNSGTGGALSIGIQVDNATAYSVTGSPSVDAMSGADASSADDFYYEFIPGVQPADDIKLVSIDVSPYLIAGNTTIMGTVKNQGSATITSFTANWDSGSGVQTATISGVNIASNGTYQFSHSTPFVGVAGQSYTIDVDVDVTGDANPSDNALSTSVTVASDQGTRLPLAEVFTSSTCPPCYSLNVLSGYDGNGLDDGLASLNANDENIAEIAAIKYQVNWPGNGDHAYTPEVGTRVSYYGITGAPTQVLNGSAGTAITPTSVASATSEFALVDIDATYTTTGNDVSVDVTIDPYVNISNAVVMIALLEKEYDATTDASFSNGETTFHNVLRKLLPDASGTTANLVDGTSFNLTESYTRIINASLPAQGSFDFHTGSDLEVVVFVEDPTTNTIFNAAIAKNGSVGIDENGLSFGITQFPNPTTGTSNIVLELKDQANVDIQVVNLVGEVVFQNNANVNAGSNLFTVDLTDQSSGVYFANVNVNGQVKTIKINVAK